MNKTLLSLKGAAMGIAEVIPGVSGGTIAFVTGIYERLLKAIKAFDMTCIRLLLQGRVREVWNYVDGGFLLFLMLGMVSGLALGVFVISYLMDNYPEVLYGFFLGLIAASAWYIGRQVVKWTPGFIGLLLIGAILAFLITRISPAEGSTHPAFIVFSGFLAVSALMLPGISGSFILLLIGMYPIVIGAVKHTLSGAGFDQLWILLCFASGMVIGLVLFSRALTWMFRHYSQLTLALLSGFMIGSLPKIWPWRVPEKWLDTQGMINTTGVPGEEAKIIAERMVFPQDYALGEPHTALTVGAVILGIMVIFGSIYFERRKRSDTAHD